jgi:hypothetical protein
MSIIGKPKQDEYDPEEAKKLAARVAKKSNPLLSKKRAEKIAAKEEKRQRKGRSIGF